MLQTRLAASLNAGVVIHESVDPSLLAGATIKVGDKIIDDSMRGKLQQLKNTANGLMPFINAVIYDLRGSKSI